MYEQCLQDFKETLESTEDWEVMLKSQLLHNLIQKIEYICLGFDDHKQEVLNLVHPVREGDGKRIWTQLEEFLGYSQGI